MRKTERKKPREEDRKNESNIKMGKTHRKKERNK